MSRSFFSSFIGLILAFTAVGQTINTTMRFAKVSRKKELNSVGDSSIMYYGVASFYADKFEGRETMTGDIYSHKKATAACNVLPLGTWIRVTNLENNKSVVVRINDRLNSHNNRIVDLSKSGAEKLGYIEKGLARVKLDVLGKKKPKL
jgi:rare lipoprotein A